LDPQSLEHVGFFAGLLVRNSLLSFIRQEKRKSLSVEVFRKLEDYSELRRSIIPLQLHDSVGKPTEGPSLTERRLAELF